MQPLQRLNCGGDGPLVARPLPAEAEFLRPANDAHEWSGKLDTVEENPRSPVQRNHSYHSQPPSSSFLLACHVPLTNRSRIRFAMFAAIRSLRKSRSVMTWQSANIG